MALSELMKRIEKKYGGGIMTYGANPVCEKGTLSLGSPSLDYCLFNSFPEGKIIEFSGRESSGKTTMAFFVANSYIRKELQRNPDHPRAILFVDVECAVDPEWAKKSTGYDMNREDVRTIHFTPTGGTSAEEILQIVIDAVADNEVGLVIIDSISYLVSGQIAGEGMEKKDMGGISKTLKDFCCKITGDLNRYGITLIGLNGVRDNLSPYGEKEITPGGNGWKQACMVRLRFKRGAFFDENGDEVQKSCANPAGHIIEMAVLKTKVCEWSRKMGMAHLNYARGMDIIADTIDVATCVGLIDNSVQGTFKLIDTETGEPILDKDGAPVKIRGKKNVRIYLEEYKDIWKKLYDKVYEKISIKADPFIKSFEDMLGADVYEKFGISEGADLNNI